MGADKMYWVCKVVTRNFVMDIVAGVQNFLGLNLTSYEKMIKEGLGSIREKMREDGVVLSWYRVETSQLTNGSVAIVLYGDRK